MSLLQEFKTFAVKGNAMDLAVGVIIGGAFGKIVDSLVGDVIMPVVGKIIGKLDFSSNYIPLAGQAWDIGLVEAKKAGPVLAWGNFITIVVNFIILAFVIFMMVKLMNHFRHQAEQATPPAPPPGPTEEVLLLREIRDALKSPVHKQD
jgi:large conductance mechanosensitive channel